MPELEEFRGSTARVCSQKESAAKEFTSKIGLQKSEHDIPWRKGRTGTGSWHSRRRKSSLVAAELMPQVLPFPQNSLEKRGRAGVGVNLRCRKQRQFSG